MSGLKPSIEPLMTKQRAVGELILAGGLWGFGFVATAWALKAYSPSELLVWRFLIATLAGELLWWVFARRRNLSPTRPASHSVRGDFLWALPAGVLLAGVMLPQTIGLQFTTASKSGFLTTLYVILVPVINHFLFKVKTRSLVYVFAVAALVGAYILMGADLSSVNPGDLWTLLCAFIAAFHIIYIGRVSNRIGDSFRFNTFQSFWCLICIAPFLLLQPEVRIWSGNLQAWFGILMLAIGSSIIGFTIQVRTQKVLSPNTASMLFLLESPFALAFGVAFLAEVLTLHQLIGAVIILSASALTVKYE